MSCGKVKKKLIEWGEWLGNDYVFCNITSTNLGFKPRNVNKKMSYTYLREIFIEAVKPHVENLKKYSYIHYGPEVRQQQQIVVSEIGC